MVATLEEKYQLSIVKLSKFTSRQPPVHSKTVPDHTVVRKTFNICPFQDNKFWVLFHKEMLLRHKLNRTARFKFGPDF